MLRSFRSLSGARSAAVWRGLRHLSASSSCCSSTSISRSSLSSSAPSNSASAGYDDVAQPDEFVFNTPAPTSPAADPTLLQPGVVIYDGVCHLCHAGVKWVIRADKYRKIKFCCLQSMAAEPYLSLCGLTREDVLRRFLFVEGPGLYYQASTAALKVASHLPLPYSALSALLVIPAPLRDAVYDFVAKRRYDWFGKEDECIVMKENEMLDRFIDREEIFRRYKHTM